MKEMLTAVGVRALVRARACQATIGLLTDKQQMAISEYRSVLPQLFVMRLMINLVVTHLLNEPVFITRLKAVLPFDSIQISLTPEGAIVTAALCAYDRF